MECPSAGPPPAAPPAAPPPTAPPPAGELAQAAAAADAAPEPAPAVLAEMLTNIMLILHVAVLRHSSVVELWKLRRVCRAFHRWGTEALASLPRVAAIGGTDRTDSSIDSVEVLDMSTLRWSADVLPALPHPVSAHSACSWNDGRVTVVGGYNSNKDATAADDVLEWAPGAKVWSTLPECGVTRDNAALVALPDGRAVAIGGSDDTVEEIKTIDVLAEDRSGWSQLTTDEARLAPAVALLPSGNVVVAGGHAGEEDRPKASVILLDTATGDDHQLPAMPDGRQCAACCLLPSGRVAVVGGWADSQRHRWWAGDVFDMESRSWSALPQTEQPHIKMDSVALPVAGGMVVVGGRVIFGPKATKQKRPDYLFDEAANRWYELPFQMAEHRNEAVAVLLRKGPQHALDR